MSTYSLAIDLTRNCNRAYETEQAALAKPGIAQMLIKSHMAAKGPRPIGQDLSVRRCFNANQPDRSGAPSGREQGSIRLSEFPPGCLPPERRGMQWRNSCSYWELAAWDTWSAALPVTDPPMSGIKYYDSTGSVGQSIVRSAARSSSWSTRGQVLNEL